MSQQLRSVLFWLVIQIPLVGTTIAVMGGPQAALDRLLQHPVAALVIAVGYEALVFLAGLAKKVWGNLEPGVVASLTDTVKVSVLNVFSRYRRHYLRQLVFDHRLFNVRGLRNRGAHALWLERVFVELRLAPKEMQQARLDPIAPSGNPSNRSLWEFFREAAKEDAVALAIIGPPGSGKSTLIQHVAITLAANRQRRYGLRAYTPVLLFLRDQVARITASPTPSMGELLQGIYANKIGLSPPPPCWFERHLQGGQCVVLLDGLDEIADTKLRQKISAWIDDQIAAYPRSKFIVTARPQGYRASPLSRAHVLETQPFGNEQVKSFIGNWYLANEVARSGGKEDEGVHQQATEQANELIQRLRLRPALSDLTRNPLLLTMIATVHSSRNALPGRRVELYAEICDVLLSHWQQARGLTPPLSAEQFRVILRPLAAHMMDARVTELRTAEVLEVIRKPLVRVGIKNEAIEGFLPDLQEKSGLFVERENDRWGFAHLTFQEYLAASHFRMQSVALDWKSMIHDSWWHETLRLYAAQGDATPLIQACLKLDSIPALTLASEFLEEAREIDPGARSDAEKRLNAAIEATEPERQRIATEVHLARRLQAMHWIDPQREIDLQYVTCAEYQLFIDELLSQNMFHQPDHWREHRFPSGSARTPVLGVRPEDAQAFADWLTARKGGGVLYRLPTRVEAESFPASQSDNDPLATWCRDGEEFGLVGLGEGVRKQLTEQLRALCSNAPPKSLGGSYPKDFQHKLAISDEIVLQALSKDRTLVDEASMQAARRLKWMLEHSKVTKENSVGVRIVRLVLRCVLFVLNPYRAISGGEPDRAVTELLVQVIGPIHMCSFDRSLDISSAPEGESDESRLSNVTAKALGLTLVLLKRQNDAPQYQSLVRLIPELISGLEMMDGAAVLRAVNKIKYKKEEGVRLLVLVVRAVADILSSKTPFDARLNWRILLAHLAADTRPGVLGALPSNSALLRVHWFMHIAVARDLGVMSAWEGIRLVREKQK